MNSKINLYCENVSLPDINWEVVTNKWIPQVITSYGRILGNLNYIFCDDNKIIEVNRQFLQHDYYTDIITFDYNCGKLVRGDLYISLDTVKSNAEGLNVSYLRELHRVIVHGVLHLCGINDKGPGEREIMEQHENNALSLFDTLSVPH